MDTLDSRILRELWRDQVIIWGGLDPRVGTAELAARLQVDRSTVWARLKAWREEGFLVRQEVVPNPALFGAGVAGGDVRVDDVRHKPEMLEALQLSDGVLCGVDHVGEYVILLYAQENPTALERCRRLLARLPHVAEVSTCIPFEQPAPAIALSASDWRIVHALRRFPDRPLGEIADEVGISRRTITRRYTRLLDGEAIWSFPLFDFSRYRGAVMARFTVLLAAHGQWPDVVNACQRDLPGMVWWDSPERGSSRPHEAPPWVDLYCHLESVGVVDDVQQQLLATPYVQEVEVSFPRRWFVVPSWFDERIELRLQETLTAGRG